MSDKELRDRVAAFLIVARTIAAFCKAFRVTRPTAVLWIGQLAEHGYVIRTQVVSDADREGERGPRAKTYRAEKIPTPTP